jgi:HEPN domain-containing protein
MSKRIIQNWITLAEYDLETAIALQKSGRYIYVAFTCQQTIEKILKALYINQKEETPPYTHNLFKLLELTSLLSSLTEEQQEFIEDLNSYYIESRYTEKIEILNQSLTENVAESILNKTKELFSWIKVKL